MFLTSMIKLDYNPTTFEADTGLPQISQLALHSKF